jgi:hypothetical protein
VETIPRAQMAVRAQVNVTFDLVSGAAANPDQ